MVQQIPKSFFQIIFLTLEYAELESRASHINYNRNASFVHIKVHTFLAVHQTSSKHEQILGVMN